MTRICVLSHSFQHSAQIRASISAPSEPGSPTFPAPSRCWPHRAQTTTATPSSYKRLSPKPADSPDRRVSEKRVAQDVRERDRAERSAVGAFLEPVAEDRAGPLGHGSDPLAYEIPVASLLPAEDALPYSRGPP